MSKPAPTTAVTVTVTVTDPTTGAVVWEGQPSRRFSIACMDREVSRGLERALGFPEHSLCASAAPGKTEQIGPRAFRVTTHFDAWILRQGADGTWREDPSSRRSLVATTVTDYAA